MSAMLILVLEAGFALGLLIFFVWWTMFSGRKPEQTNKIRPKRKPTNKKPE
ncbi:hypothetical protein H8K32_19350 [Undibacterium jejuense]|uniref:Uncharacterized protein n=1 Tax=Undibacterium jejuense TaxID=1344949 RepID=A0A923HIC0_9BURK|nr:hypothetical protein [Undibacterium jejuense]MBC3864264.1 hypothetical protein [Undibacterium jejuense]